jgi:ABC-type Zn uptake system ZnuABC Zn-binding protein ZnuA
MRKLNASLVATVVLLGGAAAADEPKTLNVLATTTDLAAIAREVGGDAVTVNCLTRGPEDPHFIDARPSYSRLAHDADVFLKVGLELEIGYEVPIVRDARNARIQPGSPGYCDASAGIDLLDIPSGTVDRSMGDVHPLGNPHYLLDPYRAKTVATTIAATLGKVDPARADAFTKRAEEFGARVDAALFGKELLAAAPARRLARLLADGKLGAWLEEKGLAGKAGGWAAEMLPYSGAKVVSYHALFNYLLDRFHVQSVASLEPKAGIPPTPRHVRTVVEVMRAQRVPAILCAIYNPKDVAESAAREAGAEVVTLAHMPGAVGEAGDYVSFVDGNVKALAKALSRVPEATK